MVDKEYKSIDEFLEDYELEIGQIANAYLIEHEEYEEGFIIIEADGNWEYSVNQ